MTSLIDLATATTRSWTSLYTWRLPDELRNGRQNEIESDLWEHRQLARAMDEPPLETGLAMLMRFAMGLPADLTWRIESGALVRSEKRSLSMNTETGALRWLVWGGYAIVVFIALMSVGSIIAGTTAGDASWAIIGGIPLVASVPIIYGLSRSATRQPLAIVLVAAGCLVITASWYWLFMFTIPASAGLIALSYYRGKRAGWRGGASTDLAT